MQAHGPPHAHADKVQDWELRQRLITSVGVPTAGHHPPPDIIEGMKHASSSGPTSPARPLIGSRRRERCPLCHNARNVYDEINKRPEFTCDKCVNKQIAMKSDTIKDLRNSNMKFYNTRVKPAFNGKKAQLSHATNERILNLLKQRNYYLREILLKEERKLNETKQNIERLKRSNQKRKINLNALKLKTQKSMKHYKKDAKSFNIEINNEYNRGLKKFDQAVLKQILKISKLFNLQIFDTNAIFPHNYQPNGYDQDEINDATNVVDTTNNLQIFEKLTPKIASIRGILVPYCFKLDLISKFYDKTNDFGQKSINFRKYTIVHPSSIDITENNNNENDQKINQSQQTTNGGSSGGWGMQAIPFLTPKFHSTNNNNNNNTKSTSNDKHKNSMPLKPRSKSMISDEIPPFMLDGSHNDDKHSNHRSKNRNTSIQSSKNIGHNDESRQAAMKARQRSFSVDDSCPNNGTDATAFMSS